MINVVSVFHSFTSADFGIPGALSHLGRAGEYVFAHTPSELNSYRGAEYRYFAQVWSIGFKEFYEWAKTINPENLYVGGPHAMINPGHFSRVVLPGRIIHNYAADDFPNYANYKRVHGFYQYGYMTSRGCRNDCWFCDVKHVSPKVVSKPLDVVEAECAALYREYGEQPNCFFYAANFLQHPQWEEVIRITIKRKVARQVHFYASSNQLDEEIVERLVRYPISAVQVGIEGIDDFTKNANLWATVRMLQSAGLHVRFSVLLTPKTNVDLVKQFLSSVGPGVVSVNYLTSFHGSPYATQYMECNEPHGLSRSEYNRTLSLGSEIHAFSQGEHDADLR